MGLDSLKRISRVVDIMASGHEISFKSVQEWWFKKLGHRFQEFKHTSIQTINFSKEDYRNWIADADLSVIAYNFDENTRRYVQYSMACRICSWTQ